jgi:hypothetical protein
LAHQPLITVALQLALIGIALSVAWTQRGLLTERHQYALVYSSILPFVVLGWLRERDPQQVEILDPTGMSVLAMLFVIAAFFLRAYLLRRRHKTAATSAVANSAAHAAS